jgi:Lon protease-like protein
MADLGLFPLGIVLLPTERIPLHVFEERYKELIGECLAEDGEFGLVYADEDGLREIGTRATVVEVLERFEDGRLDILVEGGERFRLVELTPGRAFQTGEVEEFPDEPDPADADTANRVLELFSRLSDLTGADAGEAGASGPLSFDVAARFELSPELKQRLLQLRSERERLTLLATLLEQAAKAVERERAVSRLASQNGHAHDGTE